MEEIHRKLIKFVFFFFELIIIEKMIFEDVKKKKRRTRRSGCVLIESDGGFPKNGRLKNGDFVVSREQSLSLLSRQKKNGRVF